MPYSQPRILIIPGLHDSGPAHWQTWLQGQYRDARRVTQRDPSKPELERWAERIQRTLEVAATSEGQGEWLAVAHSFGCLALALHLSDHPDSPIREALFVAPAEPDKFGFPRPSDMRYNWIHVRLDAIDREELRELVIDGWRMCVPKSVAATVLGDDA